MRCSLAVPRGPPQQAQNSDKASLANSFTDHLAPLYCKNHTYKSLLPRRSIQWTRKPSISSAGQGVNALQKRHTRDAFSPHVLVFAATAAQPGNAARDEKD